jgi:LacI family transcriptional regulator
MSGGNPVPRRQVIPPVGLVARQSTDILCVDDPALATALRTIREQACRGLQALTVAERIGLSRNTLDQLFKTMIGRTMDQEIRRVRIERAKELLARTTMPLREVAREACLGSEQYLSAVFAHAVGCRPSEYRLRHRESARSRVT